MAEVHHEAVQKSTQDIVHLYKAGQLNLSPGFQRSSVWSLSDRRKLLDTVVRNYPLPSIFLYKRQNEGEVVYDVIDGKQRLESLLMFMGVIWGHRFEFSAQLPGDEDRSKYDWKRLCKLKKQHLVTGYNLRVIEVDGDLSDIIDLFVRINSTGKALSAAEKRNAKYYNSPFLKEAGRLARRIEPYLRQSRILSPGQISRMKHVEFAAEIMLSAHQGDVINRKAALDRVMDTNGLTGAQAKKAYSKAFRALNYVKRLFPKLRQTRFRQQADFYTLAVLVQKFDEEGLAVADRKRGQLAQDMLIAFSTEVDKVLEAQKRGKGTPRGSEVYRNYLSTVQSRTDQKPQRQRREAQIRELLESLFARKDAKRLFTPEQRRIVWNTAATPKCQKCGKALTWGDFTLDHIHPYSKGGRTRLDNAAILCRRHNSSKGDRVRSRGTR